MDTGRVVFYKRNDYAYGAGMEKIENIDIPIFENIDINDAIEFYEINRYFDDGIYLKRWTDPQCVERYKVKSKKLHSLCMRYFNSLCEENIVECFFQIDNYDYDSVFWRLYDECNLYDKISNNTFRNLFSVKPVSLYDVLIHKEIVRKHGAVIREVIICDPDNTNIILDAYDQSFKRGRIFLPLELTGKDVYNIFQTYIESDDPNINTLTDIVLIKYSKEFPVTDELRLKASRKSTEMTERMFEKSTGITYGVSVEISPNQTEEKKEQKNGFSMEYSYSERWLLETLDYSSILNNFIYIFEFVDYSQMRCLHVAFESYVGSFERIFQKNTARIYAKNLAFDMTDKAAALQMLAYYNFLKRNHIRYETVLEWFFNEYLQEEFDCAEMRIQMPSEGSTWAEKCLIICGTLESVLKQFLLYVEHHEIDFELLEMMSGSKKLQDIPSQIKDKYIYGSGDDFYRIKHLMFSDQCLLKYVERIYKEGKTYSNFYDLITHEKVFLSDYPEQRHASIQELVGNGIITIRDDDSITIENQYKAAIFLDLNYNQVISKWHYPPKVYPVFKSMLDEGMLISKGSLLSDSEVKYFNYILNDAQYANGLKLRNRYSHGNQQGILDENVHMNNYFILLRIMTILVIKINDDFILREKLNLSE